MALRRRRRYLHQTIASQRWARQHTFTARLFYKTAVRRQGLLIKLGQVIGARPDIFPAEYVQELRAQMSLDKMASV